MGDAREAWVCEAVRMLRPIFKNVGYPVPERVTVAVVNSLPEGVLGQCRKEQDGYKIVVHSTLVGKSVLPVVAHEMLHAAVGISEGHGGKFASIGKRLGLWADTSQPKTHYGAVSWQMHQLLRQLEAVLGPYPQR